MYSGSTVATFAAARRRYRAYVHACVTEDDKPLLEAMRASRHAIGEASFIGETEQRLGKLQTQGLKGTGPILHGCVVRPCAVSDYE